MLSHNDTKRVLPEVKIETTSWINVSKVAKKTQPLNWLRETEQTEVK